VKFHLPVIALIALFASVTLASTAQNAVTIDAKATAHPFPHFWEQMFGSGRANLALREGYRKDLKLVHDQVGMEYVRFHGIFHDENGVYDEDEKGNPVFNFNYVDQIYDGLLAQGVKPFVEISFMPKKLTSDPWAIHPFWYKQNVAPPKDYAKWDLLVSEFAKHLIDRYGIDEVSSWYFEVWNEPNIDFWAGYPKMETYFELYDHTSRALKAVSPRLRVGGPSSSSAHWVPEFLAHVAAVKAPIDFVSSHAYDDDTVEDLFGTHEEIPMLDRVCRAIGKVDGEIKASAYPSLPLLWTEWNVPSYGDAVMARDNWFVGPALAHHIDQCDGLVDKMSFWTFDNVFEEGGVYHDPFNGGFGLINANQIKKPAFYDFSLLHTLGDERLANPAKNILVTRRKDGTLVVAAWNLVEMDKLSAGKTEKLTLKFEGTAKDARVSIQRVDERHGNPFPEYKALGSPHYPTVKQIEAINQASALPAPEVTQLKNGELELELPVNGLVVIEMRGR
jgi:xylan 1,4-beta-xylosidase